MQIPQSVYKAARKEPYDYSDEFWVRFALDYSLEDQFPIWSELLRTADGNHFFYNDRTAKRRVESLMNLEYRFERVFMACSYTGLPVLRGRHKEARPRSVSSNTTVFIHGAAVGVLTFQCYRCRKHAHHLDKVAAWNGEDQESVCLYCRETLYVFDRGRYQRTERVNERAQRAPSIEDLPRGMVHQYSAKPMDYGQGFRYLPTERLPVEPLWLGVELEVQPKDKSDRDLKWAHAIRDTLGDFAIMKRDGSIGFGVEIVTVPATLAYHRQAWDRFFDEAAPLLISWSAKNGNSEAVCGMHVHMSRAALTPYQHGKMLVFINNASNKRLIETLAGRYGSSFSRISERKVTHGLKKHEASHSGHYEALSTSTHTNGKTVELRIFRGNVARHGFFRNLEFTQALAEFCAETSHQYLQEIHFFNWMSFPENFKRFPVLAAWLQKKGFIKLRSKEKELELEG